MVNFKSVARLIFAIDGTHTHPLVAPSTECVASSIVSPMRQIVENQLKWTFRVVLKYYP